MALVLMDSNRFMNKFFSSYKQAFDNFDADSISQHYNVPCLVSDVDGLQVFDNKNKLTAKFLKNCQHLQSLGYSGSSFNIIETKRLGGNIISIDVDWKVTLDSGEYEFKTLYLCQHNDGDWLIFNAVVYE